MTELQLAVFLTASCCHSYAQVFKLLGRKRGWAVHGSGGLDEVSTLGPSEIYALEDGAIRQFVIRPEDLRLAHSPFGGLCVEAKPNKRRSLETIRGQGLPRAAKMAALDVPAVSLRADARPHLPSWG